MASKTLLFDLTTHYYLFLGFTSTLAPSPLQISVQGVRCGVFSPDGNIIATGTDDGNVVLFVAETGAFCVHEEAENGVLYSHNDYVRSVSFTPVSSWLMLNQCSAR